jgi:ribonuclease BN (tRNA processing enzyme)
LSLSDNLKLFFVEASFPDRMKDIAGISGHLTPEIIYSQIKHFKDTRVIAYHIKPRFFEEVLKDIPKGMEYIKGGEVFEV